MTHVAPGTGVERRYLLFALLAFALFVAEGLHVAHQPALWFDRLVAAEWFGRATETAEVFTVSGYGIAVAAAGALALAIAVVLRYEVARVVSLLVTQSLAQAAIDGLKVLFARPRPPVWLVHHESGFSYPSGHAATAVLFYGGLALLVAAAPLPLRWRRLATAVIVLWALGICWSRIALGAHNASDVLGGAAFGAGCLALVAVLWLRLPLGAARSPAAGR